MTIDRTLASIDAEISRLKQVRALLSSDGAENTTTASPVIKRRKKMSAAARKKIADAQRKRWAKQKSTAASK
jgi:hypothetical protein